MISSTNRAARRKTLKRAKSSALAGAAAAALIVGLAGAPSASAAIPVDIDIDPAYTAGTLASIIDFLGNAFPGTNLGGIYDSGPPATIGYSIGFPYSIASTDIFLNVDASLYLDNIGPADTQYLYDTLGSIPQPTCANNYATNCRYSLMLGTSEATLNLANAYRTQITGVTTGQTPAGYIPFQASAGSTAAKPTQTNQALGFVQNPLRPNGGFLARFPGLSDFLGQDPGMPAAGLYKSLDGTIAVNSTTLDATWAYDPTGDFPAVFNLFSILNSLNAFLPINLASGLDPAQPFVLANPDGTVAEFKDLGLNLAALFQVRIAPVPALGSYTLPMEPGKAYYATVVPNQLPLFNGIRLPALLVNAALGALNAPFRLGTPLSDALEPAFKILVNIGYDDVVTPDMIAADPSKFGSYQPYDRTFLNPGVVTPFGSVDPLTREEQSQVAGDVFQALLSGFGAQFAKPFWGIIEPADSPEAAASTPSTTARAAAAMKPGAAVPRVNPAAPEPALVAAQTAVESAATPHAAVSAPEPIAAQRAVPVTAPASAPASVADPAEVAVSAPAHDPARADSLRESRSRTPRDAPAPGTPRSRASASSEASEASTSAPRQRAARSSVR